MQIADVLDYLHKRPSPSSTATSSRQPDDRRQPGPRDADRLRIARWVAPQGEGVTAVGTMGYAPPELFSGKVEPL